MHWQNTSMSLASHLPSRSSCSLGAIPITLSLTTSMFMSTFLARSRSSIQPSPASIRQVIYVGLEGCINSASNAIHLGMVICAMILFSLFRMRIKLAWRDYLWPEFISFSQLWISMTERWCHVHLLAGSYLIKTIMIQIHTCGLWDQKEHAGNDQSRLYTLKVSLIEHIYYLNMALDCFLIIYPILTHLMSSKHTSLMTILTTTVMNFYQISHMVLSFSSVHSFWLLCFLTCDK